MTETNQRQAGQELELSPAALQQFADMVYLIPDADFSGGGERILQQIMDATDVAGLEAPWAARQRKFPLGVPVRVVAVAKAPSDFAGGLPFYLECDCVDIASGEQVVYATGSTSCTAQLTRASFLDELPIVVKLVRAEKASSGGFFPEHFEVVQAPSATAGASKRG